MKRKMVIAITGGIGSGKSVVAKYLRSKGFVTVDCDVLAKNLSNNLEIIEQVGNLLGQDCIVNGRLDRAKIRSIIFADEKLHKAYSNLFHDKIKQLLCSFKEDTTGTFFVEIPVFDAFDFDWDEVWLVERDQSLRVQSVMQRDGVSKQNVMDIISKQNVCTNYTAVLRNGNDLQQLYLQIDNLLSELKLL